MAVMYPEQLSTEDVPSAAERRVHARLRELDRSYTVFHSPAWIVGGRDARQPVTGEADFVVAHPDRGALILEVKGGSIAFDPASGTWSSTGRSGTHAIKDPFRQARRSRFALQTVISRMSGKGNDVPTGEGVVFPDCVVTSSDVPPLYPPEAVLDRLGLDDVQCSLERVFDYWGLSDNRQNFGTAGVSRLVRALAHPTQIHAPLGFELADADQRLVELTRTQHRVLTALSGNHRVSIVGSAGTAKTLLASEQSRRLATQGHDVLLTCFNKGLADYLAASLSTEPRVVVRHFHQLCREWATDAGFDPRPGPGTRQEHYTDRLPSLLTDAAAVLDRRFGAVVIDEAQDFDPGWLTALELLLDDLDRGVIYMFGDNNQAIYGRGLMIPPNFVQYRLTENCRNTQAIHAALAECFPDQAEAVLGPPGIDIEIVGWSNEREFAKALSRVLHRWIVDERVASSEVVVLSGHRPARSLVRRVADRIGRFDFVEGPSGPGQIRLASVHSFKGLESPLVILCELDDAWPETRRELWYTALSRARVHLIVLTHRRAGEESPDIRELLEEAGVC